MSSKKKEVELKLIRTDTRLLTCKLKPEEIENAGRELATITQQIEGEKARQKNLTRLQEWERNKRIAMCRASKQ